MSSRKSDYINITTTTLQGLFSQRERRERIEGDPEMRGKKRMDDSGVGRKDEANYHSHSRHVITLLTVVRPSTLSRAQSSVDSRCGEEHKKECARSGRRAEGGKEERRGGDRPGPASEICLIKNEKLDHVIIYCGKGRRRRRRS